MNPVQCAHLKLTSQERARTAGDIVSPIARNSRITPLRVSKRFSFKSRREARTRENKSGISDHCEC